MSEFKTIQWNKNYVTLLDQTQLPGQEVYLKIDSVAAMAEAIEKLRIRGAPAIGIAAAYGLVIGAKKIRSRQQTDFIQELNQMAEFLAATRPTAINLRWAIQRVNQKALDNDGLPVKEIIILLEDEAIAIHNEDIRMCQKIAKFGAALFSQKPVTILTHCNAGILATGGQGTALGIIYELKNKGIDVRVYADETRPILQGTRLTAWELNKAGIPITLICDNMASIVMGQKKIDGVIVGADRITGNGDVANKIGTFTVALAAREFNIPFYLAAPYSTFDFSLKSGNQIPIEDRSPEEITHIGNKKLAPDGISVYNPAFDITPNKLITAIITDRGVCKPPFFKNINKLPIKS